MNQSILSLCLITVGIGLCGFYGAQLPSTLYKQTSATLAKDWLSQSKAKANSLSSSVGEAKKELELQVNQLKLNPRGLSLSWLT